MSNSSSQVDLYHPFENQPKPNFFNKLGQKFGDILLSTKKVAKRNYLELTQGINQRIEEEDERIQEEINLHLAAQAEEFEYQTYQLKKRWFWFAFILVVISFCIGVMGAFFFLK